MSKLFYLLLLTFFLLTFFSCAHVVIEQSQGPHFLMGETLNHTGNIVNEEISTPHFFWGLVPPTYLIDLEKELYFKKSNDRQLISIEEKTDIYDWFFSIITLGVYLPQKIKFEMIEDSHVENF